MSINLTKDERTHLHSLEGKLKGRKRGWARACPLLSALIIGIGWWVERRRAAA